MNRHVRKATPCTGFRVHEGAHGFFHLGVVRAPFERGRHPGGHVPLAFEVPRVPWRAVTLPLTVGYGGFGFYLHDDDRKTRTVVASALGKTIDCAALENIT